MSDAWGAGVGDRFADALQEHGIQFKRAGGSLILTCPRCGHHEKLWVRRRDGRTVCWHCPGGPRSAAAGLAMLLGVPQARAEALLGVGAGPAPLELSCVVLDPMGPAPPRNLAPQVAQLPPRLLPPTAVDLRDPAAAAACVYLTSRGVPPPLAWAYSITYEAGANRLLFPLFQRGNLVGWQGRWCGPEGTAPFPGKIATSPGVAGAPLVMFADRLRPGGDAVFGEGPFDALKAHLCGGNVGFMGKGITDGQLDIVAAAGVRRCFIGIDPDALSELPALAQRVRDRRMEAYDMVPRDGRDLGKHGFLEVLSLKRAAAQVVSGVAYCWADPSVARSAGGEKAAKGRSGRRINVLPLLRPGHVLG